MTIIGSGIDIIEVERIKKVVSQWGNKFLNRVFTKKELTYCNLRGSLKFQSLAARFAAKEAVIKALGAKDIALRDIAIINNGEGKPECVINPSSIIHHPSSKILLSISHTKDHAVASALLITGQHG